MPLAQRPVQAVPPVTPLAAPMPIAAKPTVANIGPPKPVPQAEVTPPPVNTVPPPDTKDVFAELESRIDSNPPPMNLGAKRTKSLAERIADLKEQNFNHATTRFPLTGKHAKADCESCHVKTLENNPRECVACHKKDDVHRGRRTECGQCHTTVSFSGPKKR